jgi:hypothetical protein
MKSSACPAITRAVVWDTVTIHGAYRTFCTAALWKRLSDKGLESFNTGMEDRPWPLGSNTELLWEKKNKKGKLEVLSRQKVGLFTQLKNGFVMFDSKTLHPPDDDLTEVKTQINTQYISSVKSKLCSDGIYCYKI